MHLSILFNISITLAVFTGKESKMTKKVFWQDPYLTELETIVQSVNGNQITLKETIFFAFSGGQESDHGTIGGHPVLEARKDGKEIFYTLDENHGLNVSDQVKILIDWPRRYSLMRLHFAAEVVLELVCQRFPDVLKVGAHIAQDKSRIDFEWNQNISPFISSLQQAAQNIIDANQEIISAFSDEDNERRYWKINEFSQVPCGGTHIKKTGEIGTIRLKRVNPGKGRERIEIYVP
jgi:alanyl-tRNA synthetase